MKHVFVCLLFYAIFACSISKKTASKPHKSLFPFLHSKRIMLNKLYHYKSHSHQYVHRFLCTSPPSRLGCDQHQESVTHIASASNVIHGKNVWPWGNEMLCRDVMRVQEENNKFLLCVHLSTVITYHQTHAGTNATTRR